MRKHVIATLALLLCVFLYLLIGKKSVSVIDAHYDGNTAQIIVDKLPLLDSNKIEWWNKNQKEIRGKYNIPTGENGPFLITIYAFGDGYKEEEDKDRRCFSDIKKPKNCIDKNILMTISCTRNGGVKYDF